MPLALLLVLPTHNNTDGNKLMIFSSIAWYYGDTYILSPAFSCQCTVPYGKKFSQTKIVLLTIIAIVNSKKNSIMPQYSEQVKTAPQTVHSRLHALHNVAGWLAIVRLVLTETAETVCGKSMRVYTYMNKGAKAKQKWRPVIALIFNSYC